MNKILSLLLASAAINLIGPASAQASPPQRYREEFFSAIKSTKNLIYGQAINISGQMETLRLDLYEPQNDSAQTRPVMIWIHGGGFTGGDKSDEQITELCTRFAKRGYVTASLNYRMRKQWSTLPEYFAAVQEAKEDAQAAVRWFRAQAQTYRCDTTRIAIGGSSAGATTALHATYEISAGTSGNPRRSSKIAACVEFWGALNDKALMETGEAPLLIVHGTADSKVPYTAAALLQSRAQEVGVPYELHALQGAGHAAWEYMPELISWTSDFLFKHVISKTPTGVETRAPQTPQSPALLQNYPNPVSVALADEAQPRTTTTIRYEILQPSTATLRLFNALGQEVRTLFEGWREPGVYTQKLVVKDLPLGIYFYRLHTKAGVLTRKLLITK